MGTLQSSFSDNEADTAESYKDPAEPARLVRGMLFRLGLPTELVLEIMDFADYHPVISEGRTDLVTLRADDHRPDDHSSARLYLLCPPIPGGHEGESWRTKSVEWTIEAHDQGWGGDHPGTFHSSYSWSEACIFRRTVPTTETSDHGTNAASDLDLDLDDFLRAYDLLRETKDVAALLEQQAVGWMLVPNGTNFVWRVQHNRVAQSEFKQYTVVWRAGELADADDAEEHGRGTGAGFLGALRPGDRIALWMRALYPGWENHVRKALIALTYEVR